MTGRHMELKAEQGGKEFKEGEKASEERRHLPKKKKVKKKSNANEGKLPEKTGFAKKYSPSKKSKSSRGET